MNFPVKARLNTIKVLFRTGDLQFVVIIVSHSSVVGVNLSYIWRFHSMAIPGFQELFESRIKTSF